MYPSEFIYVKTVYRIPLCIVSTTVVAIGHDSYKRYNLPLARWQPRPLLLCTAITG